MAVVVCGATVLVSTPGHAGAATGQTQNVLSDSYYHLDPDSGTLTVRVEATIQNATAKDLASVYLWAAPRAQNLAVTREGVAQEIKSSELSDYAGSVGVITVALPKPMKANARFDFVMTYDVPAQKNSVMSLEPGALELPLLGQGAGSFVWVDVPVKAENYFDPGCLKASDQPGPVKESGYERWVCGDATLIALSSDDASVQKRCANADDKCRQRLTASPYSAYVQSISDLTLRGSKEVQVTLGGRALKLTLGYFRRDETWAAEQFATAVAALPKLNDLFGFPYPKDQILMRESHHIDTVGAAGVAFPSEGQVLLATGTGFDREVTIHELAHQWAGENLQSNWLWEGLAEYAMRVVAPELGVTPIDRRWQSLGYTDALATWLNGSAVYDPNYWYGKAGAFWFTYEAAIGGRESMKVVLARIDDDPARLPLDGKWFMDAGEYASGANLDSLFLGWVFNAPTAGAMVQERRAAHDLVSALAAREAEFGFRELPTDLQANLDAWTFGDVAAQAAQVDALLAAYRTVVDLSTAAGLPVTDNVPRAWGSSSVTQIASMVENQRQAVDAIARTAQELAGEAGNSPALANLAAARDRYAAGDFSEAKRLASLAITALTDKGTAGKMLELAKTRQASYKPNLLSRLGLFLMNPGGDLAEAQAAYDAGDSSRALRLAKSAYEGWDGATARGAQRLAILLGSMAGLCVLAYYLLRRVHNGDRGRGARSPGAARSRSDRWGSWRDWQDMK